MKRKSMKVAAVAMTTMLCLSACTSTGKLPNQNDGGVTGVSIEPIGDNSDTGVSNNTQDDTGYPITLVTHAVSASNEERELCTGSYQEIILSEEYKEKYPKLAEYIFALNSNHSYGMQDNVAQYAAWAAEDVNNDVAEYFANSSVTIARIDDNLCSIIIGGSEYTGGAHPNSGCSSNNVDPMTGEELRLDQVLNDSSILPDGIRTELEKAYPGIMEEVESFYYQGEGEDPDQFKQKLIDNTYTWTIDAQGLNITFSPYEIASYAAGFLEITLSPADYPDLIQSKYILDQPQDMTKIVTTIDGENVTVEPKEMDAGPEYVTVDNPTWKKYKADSVTPGTDHITLTKVKEEKTDWLNTEVWAEKNGFTLEYLTHEDENYFYSGENDISGYGYMYQWLLVYDSAMENVLYGFDLQNLCNGPDYEEEKYSATTQYIRYATIVDNTLYAEIGHQGYASEESWSSYIVAIDLSTNELLFRSEPLVANAENFRIVGDTIICGYGFTDEPDYIYLLDRFTGEKYETISVNSGPYQFMVQDDTLYVATYNTAYEFKISR